jgi:MFS family permease
LFLETNLEHSLGGFEYGYQQGVLGQSLVMTRFTENFPTVVASSTATGWLTSILQVGGIIGSLSAGVLGEIISRKYTMFIACCWVILGSYLYVGATVGNPACLYAGRFFTGLGVGLFSGVGPLYNAELAAPEMRGLLVSFYQLATILGIMISFWVGYGSNYIGGTGDGQSDLAWRLPSIIQGIPAACLACGIWFMPFSPGCANCLWSTSLSRSSTWRSRPRLSLKTVRLPSRLLSWLSVSARVCS